MAWLTLSKIEEIMIFGVIILQTGLGGGTLIFSYIRRRGSFFWVQNFEVQFFFRVFRKINIFWV